MFACSAGGTRHEREGPKNAYAYTIPAILSGADMVSDLEISKPQKNSRNATATAAGDNLRLGLSRRSRSPEYGRGPLSPRGSWQRTSGDRFDRAYDSRGGRNLPFSDFRDEPRRRDDYPPMRSPSPRGYRGRDEYRGTRDRSRDRYDGGRRSRSRSPIGRNGRYRSPSPRRRDPDEELNLLLPKRDPRDVPEVQVILLDEIDRSDSRSTLAR